MMPSGKLVVKFNFVLFAPVSGQIIFGLILFSFSPVPYYFKQSDQEYDRQAKLSKQVSDAGVDRFYFQKWNRLDQGRILEQRG